MNGDDQCHEKVKERQMGLAKQSRRSKLTRPAVLIFAASFLLMGLASQTKTAEGQYVSLAEKVPPTSGCYKPELYDHGVNMDIKVWSGSLTAGDLRPLGIPQSEGLELAFEGLPQVQAGRLAKVVAKDLSRLKDTGIVVDNALPKDAGGGVPVHFYVQINLEALKRTSGEVTGYVAAVHLEEVCSLWGEGKDIGFGIREVEIPGLLILSTMTDIVRDLEGLVYDNLMDVVKARRQAIADVNSKNKHVVPEKKP